jgi:hypothetical protein
MNRNAYPTKRVSTDTGGEFLGRDANQPERSAMIGHLNHSGSACPAD